MRVRNPFRLRLLCYFCAAVLIYGLADRLIAQSTKRSATIPSPQPTPQITLIRNSLKLGDRLPVHLAARPPLSKRTADDIQACIAQLASIDSPDIGLSPTLTGQAFLPIPNMAESGMMLITDHHLKQSEALKKLVEYGPDALRYLLDALSDKTPTKLMLGGRSPVLGALLFSNELWGNPLNDTEYNILANWKTDENFGGRPRTDSYTVKVGDVCLVAIGQIVGRDYEAVRYQPTAIVIINSPVEDPAYCQAIRTIWGSTDPRQRLFDSFMFDCATQTKTGIAEYRSEALMRLLFYFPQETTGSVAQMLRKLDVRKAAIAEAALHQPYENGFSVEGLVSTVSWCKQPEIKALVHDIFAKTDDASVLLAALPGIESTDNTLIRDRIQSFLNEVPSTEQVDHDYQLLQAAADRLGSASSPMFDGFLKNGNPDRCYTVTQVLRGTRDPWAIDILRRLLSDRRNIGDYTYATGKSDDGPRLPIRVCDVAAQVLADTRPNLKFMLEGQYSDLDKQIAVMQKALLK